MKTVDKQEEMNQPTSSDGCGFVLAGIALAALIVFLIVMVVIAMQGIGVIH